MRDPRPNTQKKNVRVSRTTGARAPEQLRRVGRALIELARAQLEAEAEAEHAKREAARKRGRS